MCTCLEYNSFDHYFGRTLDLDFHYKEEATIVPRNYKFSCPNSKTFITKYAMIGTALIFNDYPLFYEGANEYGLAIAGLNFPYNAKYFEPKEGKLNLTPFEFIPYFLGNYKTIEELRNDLENLNLTDACFASTMPLSPLHFMISDGKDCLVLETSTEGMKIFENPYGVMTNNPPFDKQILNIKKIENLTNKFVEHKEPEFGCVGLGAIDLPGDFSSESRFLKTYFLRKYVKKHDNEEENISEFFHILDSVSMVKGSVLTKQDKDDFTFYTSCINTTKGIYYYKTYDNNQISVLKMNLANKTSKKLTRYPLITKQNFNHLNEK